MQPLLDGIVAYLPAPTDIAAFKGHAVNDEEKVIERRPDVTEPFSALAPSRS